uniref:Uncharacterized protein n=1 Tax=Arundo donax TaxID=35708 RepID=A0A0A9CE20_ARUDO
MLWYKYTTQCFSCATGFSSHQLNNFTCAKYTMKYYY